MEIQTLQTDSLYQVTLRGNFTFGDNQAFRQVLEAAKKAEIKQIIFKIDHLEFIDSAALGMLLLAHEEAEKSGKRILISGANGQVKRVFDMARFDQFFTFE